MIVELIDHMKIDATYLFDETRPVLRITRHSPTKLTRSYRAWQRQEHGEEEPDRWIEIEVPRTYSFQAKMLLFRWLRAQRLEYLLLDDEVPPLVCIDADAFYNSVDLE
jgi:hypothetical protein